MARKLTVITIFSMFLGIVCPPLPTAFAQRPAESKKEAVKAVPAKFALLVGIDDYPDKDIPDLYGTQNDVRLMREMLTDLYEFKAESDIRELLSSSKNEAERPTRRAILESFDKHLVENAKKYFIDNKLTSPEKGATVVYYYSGHGSHVADDNSDESDGEDETIVPVDSDVKGTKDIRDDEFEKRFSELKKYTSNITFIFDSCHSGTITRGAGRRSLARPALTAKSRGDGTDAPLDENMDSEGERYVTISGSLPNELSHEDALPSQRDIRRKLAAPKMEMNGLMTYFLVQTLREMPDATYREVMKRVGAAVQKRNAEQHPQVEGDLDRAVFGSPSARGRTGISIKDVKTQTIEKNGSRTKESTVTIEAGKIVGAYPGGAAGIYGRIGDNEPLAIGEIVEAGDFSATLKIVEKNIPADAKVVLLTPFFGSNKRLLALDLTPRKNTPETDDAGLQMIKRLSKKLENNDYVTARGLLDPLAKAHPKDWNAAIVRSTYGEFKKGNRQGVAGEGAAPPPDTDEIYYLASTNGNPLYNFYVKADDPNAVEYIREALEKFVRVDNLRTLVNESSELGKGLELKIIKLKPLNDPPRSMRDIVEDGFLEGSFLTPGSFFSFEIANQTGNALFPYIYSIGTDGAVKLLYEPVSDGDRLFNNISMKTLSARVFAKARAPYGTETFILIAASERFNGILLESPAIARERSKGFTNPFENLLAQASTNTRSEVYTFEFSGWATTSLDIEIREK